MSVVGALTLSVATLTSAGAVEPDALQQEINGVLSRTEGGVQISRNEIAWHGGEVIMSLPLPGEIQAPVSTSSAQKLQAKVGGVPLSTKEVVTTKADSGALAVDNCPTQVFGADWYCFYQYKDFGGRRLQWSKRYEKVMFSSYDFVNKASSWSNKGDLVIVVYGRTVSGSDASCNKWLWAEFEHTRSASVTADNQADCFNAYKP
ncbi:peptidase inhibitor family I36 protein [Streptomyces microflavus]|uniref:peptidase inhibitor family I36 protein n=1 Tax=Streptomyces microflavus TaxID=1919 RepID=UPI0037D8351D